MQINPDKNVCIVVNYGEHRAALTRITRAETRADITIKNPH